MFKCCVGDDRLVLLHSKLLEKVLLHLAVFPQVDDFVFSYFDVALLALLLDLERPVRAQVDHFPHLRLILLSGTTR